VKPGVAWALLALVAGGLCHCRTDEEADRTLESAPSTRLTLEPPTIQASPPPPPTSALAEDFEDEDFLVQVRTARLCTPVAPFLPPAEHRRLAVDVEVTAKTERLVPVSPLTFWLEDEGGQRFGATLAGCGPAFSNRNLQRAQSIRGEVAFDVPQSARDLRLIYQPFLVGRAQVTAHLALPSSTH